MKLSDISWTYTYQRNSTYRGSDNLIVIMNDVAEHAKMTMKDNNLSKMKITFAFNNKPVVMRFKELDKK
jgi:hypothetical protein